MARLKFTNTQTIPEFKQANGFNSVEILETESGKYYAVADDSYEFKASGEIDLSKPASLRVSDVTDLDKPDEPSFVMVHELYVNKSKVVLKL